MAGKIISTNLETSEKTALVALQKLINSIKELRNNEDAGLQRENLGVAQKKVSDGLKAVANARKGYAAKKKKIKEALTKANADLTKAKSLWGSIEVSAENQGGAAEVLKLIANALKAAGEVTKATVAT